MDRGRSSNPFFLLLAFSVIAATVAPRAGSPDPAPASVGRPERTVPPLATDYRAPLDQFLGEHFGGAGVCSPKLAEGLLTIHSLIATLPDPSEPRVADSFDAYLASIQLALAQAGYVSDQFWLPWNEGKRKGENAAAVRDQPGVILFRRQPAEPARRHDEIVALLVVGETPTGGIHPKAAFEHALAYASALADCSSPSGKHEFHIVGPSFSGTAYSLSESLRSWLREHPDDQFRIRSGSATNADTKAILERDPYGPAGATHRVVFSATVLPDSALQAFYDYLALSFGTDGRAVIAKLTESNTSYGQGSKAQPGEAPKKKRAPPPPSPQTLSLSWLGGFFDPSYRPEPKPFVFELPFPLHVAQVGAEYEKARAQVADKASILPTGMPLVLGLNLAEDNESGDVVGAFSPMTRSSSDLSLANSLAVISRGHMNLVGIVATDPRDEVFLAEAVHRAAPDTQIFLTEADLLFTHPSLADALRGAIVVSRYPLQILNQLWSPPHGDLWRDGGRRPQFATGAAEGVYNATLLMLREFGAAVQPIEYGMPFAATSRLPPLWIGIVGHETILPVRAIAPPETVSDSDTSAAAAGWRTALRYAEAVVVEEKDPAVIFPAGQLHTAATLLLLAILVWLMAQAFPAPSKEARRSPRRWLRQLAFPALQAFVARRRPLLSAPPPAIAACDELARPYLSIQLLAWEALVAVYVAAVAPLVAPFSAEIRILAPFGGSPPAHALALVLWILSVAVLLSFLGILHVRLRRLGKAKCSPSFPGAFGWHAAPLCWFGGAAVLAISMWFGFGVLRASPEEQIFLWVRTSNWLSGVSPTLPLVFFGLGIIATATAHLRRLELAAIERAGIRLSSLLAPQNSTLVDLEGRAGRIAEGRYLTRTGRLVAVTAATATILVLTRLRPTVEGDAWTLLMEFLLAAVVAGLVHGIVLLIQVWYTTRRTLDQIAAHPIAATYIRLRERLAGVIGLHPFGAAPRSEPLEARVRTCVARLRATPGDPDDALIHDETLAAAAHLAGTGWEAPSDADRPKLEVRSELVALQVARTLLQRVSLIRALVGALTINGLVLLLSTRIYPFQPHSLLSALAWALVLLVVAACVWTLLEMERDAMLSYLSGSEPGKITWDSGFVSQLLVYAGLPLLALVAAHFPEVGKPLFDWIRPVAGSLK